MNIVTRGPVISSTAFFNVSVAIIAFSQATILTWFVFSFKKGAKDLAIIGSMLTPTAVVIISASRIACFNASEGCIELIASTLFTRVVVLDSSAK